jgi:hypothetical protein
MDRFKHNQFWRISDLTQFSGLEQEIFGARKRRERHWGKAELPPKPGERRRKWLSRNSNGSKLTHDEITV